jgi:hypothetical protein
VRTEKLKITVAPINDDSRYLHHHRLFVTGARSTVSSPVAFTRENSTHICFPLHYCYYLLLRARNNNTSLIRFSNFHFDRRHITISGVSLSLSLSLSLSSAQKPQRYYIIVRVIRVQYNQRANR